MDTKAVKQYGYEEGYGEGEKFGLAKGKKIEKLKDAKKMLELNIPIEKIIEITGLSREEIGNID